MARANRLGGQGGVFHVTHRCHNRAFLLKFARDRDAYRTKLRQKLSQFDVSLLDYCVTSNHVHLLLDTPDRLELGEFMREVASETGSAYNRRKGRLNAFWGDNYHATQVEPGEYLWRCLCYIELNMVRCGVVSHPQHWEWVGYHDIVGRRQRYRVVDLDRLCWRLGTNALDEVRRNLTASLAARIERGEAKREPCWTESLAVGSMGFVQRIKPLIRSRVETGIVEASENVWALQEAVVAYGQK